MQPQRTRRPYRHFGDAPEYLADSSTGCWEWQRRKTEKGYGLRWLKDEQRSVRAHRWYYEQAKGPIPDGLQIDHLCRNPGCVNPDHLEAVTPATNTRRGNSTRLTAEDVAVIRARPMSVIALCQRYGISRAHCYNILYGKWWKDS